VLLVQYIFTISATSCSGE